MGLEGKVFVMFIVDSDGYINNIRSRGPDKSLEQEAERIIKSLPKMIPGRQREKAVSVPYSIPITFKIED
jgi:protein TonB